MQVSALLFPAGKHGDGRAGVQVREQGGGEERRAGERLRAERRGGCTRAAAAARGPRRHVRARSPSPPPRPPGAPASETRLFVQHERKVSSAAQDR